MVSQHPFKIAGMDLSGYMVEDASRAIGFYRDVLGLEPVLVYPDNRARNTSLRTAQHSACGAEAVP